MSQVINSMSQQFVSRVVFLTEATSSLRRFGSTYALDGNRRNFNCHNYLPLEVMKEMTEL